MGIFVTALIVCISLPEKYYILQFLVYINIQDSSVFYIDFVLGQCLQRNLTSVLEERFPEIESLNENQSPARRHN